MSSFNYEVDEEFENDILDEYFKEQQQKIFKDNLKISNRPMFNDTQNEQTNQIPQLSMNEIFQKENMELKQSISKSRVGKNTVYQQQLKQMNQVQKVENEDEKLLFTVNSTLQDKYLSKHLKADLGSLGQFMKVNELYEPKRVSKVKHQTKQQKSAEELAEDQKRLQTIKQNPIKVLANDVDETNKKDAANFMVGELIGKAFGENNIGNLKQTMLNELNFDMTQTERLNIIAKNPTHQLIHNINKKQNNFYCKINNTIELIEHEKIFRQQKIDQRRQMHRHQAFQEKKKNTTIAQSHQSKVYRSSFVGAPSKDKEQWDGEFYEDKYVDLKWMAKKARWFGLEDEWAKYMIDKQEIDQSCFQIISRYRKSVNIQINQLQKHLKQQLEQLPKEIFIIQRDRVQLINIVLTEHQIFSIFISQISVTNLVSIELNNLKFSDSVICLIFQVLTDHNQNRLKNLSLINIVNNSLVIDYLIQLIDKFDLESLQLNHLGINTRLFIQLLKPIINRSSIQSLDVSYNKIDDLVVQSIQYLIRYVTPLQQINFQQNDIVEKSKFDGLYKRNVVIQL